MNWVFSKYKSELFLFLFASIWIFCLNFFLQIFNQNYIYPDTASYIKASEEFYLFFKPNEFRPSLIAVFAGFPLLFNFSKSALFGWNIFLNLSLWFFAVVLIFKICCLLVNKKIAFYISLLYILSVGSALIIFEFLAETIFTFFLLVTIYLLQYYVITKKTFYIISALSVLALSALIKPVTLGLFVLALIFYCYINFKKILISKYSLMLYLSVFILLGHMYAMKKAYGNFTLSYIDTYTYYNYLGTRADCLKNNETFVQGNNYRYRYFISLSSSEGKKEAIKDMEYQLINNTSNFFKAYFINLKYNSNVGSGYFYAYSNNNNDSNFEDYKTLFRGLSRFQNIFYTLTGLVLAAYCLFKSKVTYLRETAFIVLYIIFISAISSDQADRFHIVVYPLILILIAGFISERFKPFAEQPQKYFHPHILKS